ncbi:MAG: excinuclease ABC subunit UvrA, partial [Candidatus Acidiferrales bacterium]
LVVPDKSKTLNQGAIEPWTKPRYRQLVQSLKKYARAKSIPLDAPWHALSVRHRDAILHGDPGEDFGGVQGFFNWLERKKYKLHVRVFLSRYRGYATCPDCRGARLRPEARAVTIAGKPITEVCAMTVTAARAFFAALNLGPERAAIAAPIFTEIRDRLRYLDEVGLDYLTLDRLTSTLSGGEAQRIQLATCLGSNLAGALYVLDEPSIGLHPRDTARLIAILKSLRDLGNTILVVEHDPDTISAADYLLDLGPGAGEHGGHIVFAGPREKLLANGNGKAARIANGAAAPGKKENRRQDAGGTKGGNGGLDSLTARYLRGELRIPVPAIRTRPNGKFLKLCGARVHNLQNIDVMIPLGTLVVITGVSGSGKSTLVYDVLFRAIQARRNRADISAFCDRIEGDHLISDAVLVDQSPIGRTPRSNPATYMKAFDAIRETLAAMPEAEKRGYSAGHFSFNIPGGRCETCQGDGTVTVEMQFLADVELVCDDCRGTRFKSGVLEVAYRGTNVHEILAFTIREALGFFSGVPKVTSRLKILDEIGLGYLRLGQSATTLSGGEAQRLKLAAHLNRQRGANGDSGDDEEDNRGMLYILDEPTTGLHFDDIQKLLGAFRKLQDGGASLVVIEHNLDVIKSADWVIDLGPEGGERGGRVIAAGTPEQVARNSQSHTAKFLARALNHSSAANHK